MGVALCNYMDCSTCAVSLVAMVHFFFDVFCVLWSLRLEGVCVMYAMADRRCERCEGVRGGTYALYAQTELCSHFLLTQNTYTRTYLDQ